MPAQNESVMTADSALIVMVRYPEAGKTKTRLARSIGDKEAASLYRAFLKDLAERFAGQECDVYWACTPCGIDYTAFLEYLVPAQAEHIVCFAQEGTYFGERLHNAFRSVYAAGYRRIILIGSDLPHISRRVVCEARAALDHADVVLGPADDGGYYLIAMREPHDVFSNIPMSTAVVTHLTIEAARRQHLTHCLLEYMFDIDELADLERLALLLEHDSSLAPYTAAHLATVRNLR